jgi:hypothetical protein
MQYIPSDTEVLSRLFDYIATKYSHIEEVPAYLDEPGIADLRGVFSGVQQDYYPTLIEKATYLLVGINKGHFFSNGNKRLSAVVLLLFLDANDFKFQDKTKVAYEKLLSDTFPERPEVEWEDFSDFSPTDFALYHLCIEIARSGAYGIEHGDLKERVGSFLGESVEQF